MNLLPSKLSDIPRIMQIIADAQSYLKSMNIDQWQDGYPNEAQIELDIKNNDSYIIINEENKIIGTTVFTTKGEPTYNEIDGNWLTPKNSTYGVIHRLAVKAEYRKSGVAKFILNECENRLKQMQIKSMRIDTHRENKGMQNLIKKLGYTYCGIITVRGGSERLAYEKILN